MSVYRIDEVLVRDKFVNIDSVAKILEEEVSSVVRNYLSCPNDAVVRFKKVGDKFVFNIEIVADRIKPFGKTL